MPYTRHQVLTEAVKREIIKGEAALPHILPQASDQDLEDLEAKLTRFIKVGGAKVVKGRKVLRRLPKEHLVTVLRVIRGEQNDRATR